MRRANGLGALTNKISDILSMSDVLERESKYMSAIKLTIVCEMLQWYTVAYTFHVKFIYPRIREKC